MVRWPKAVVLVAVVCAGVVLAGCPGMPGVGGGAGAEQRTPPGVLPPPGLESGGVRTLMGTTIVAPDNSYLLVRFSRGEKQPAPTAQKWQTCRRVSVLENCVLIEGLNYDGRDDSFAKDANWLIAYPDLAGFEWKYEARPAPPAQEQGKGQGSRGRKPR
ncbi:MAG: hypothetical protein ACE149_13465 [Armatimonadota bacterium]